MDKEILTPHQLRKKLENGDSLEIGDYTLMITNGEFAIYYTTNDGTYQYIEPSMLEALVALVTMAGDIMEKA